MTEGNFVDYVKIHASSGKGGKGSTHLHREKYIAKGGPDGGDGGRGGHVIFKGDKNLWTLLDFKFSRHFKAEHGGDGRNYLGGIGEGSQRNKGNTFLKIRLQPVAQFKGKPGFTHASRSGDGNDLVVLQAGD